MNPYDNVTFLVGDRNVEILPFPPYDDLLCDFLNDLSRELRSFKEISDYPDVMAFAFWCRKSNISKFKKEFNDGTFRLGLGVVFHIAPSNVPVNFAFSFAFGLLSGNANIVRVPSKIFPQISIICSAIDRLFTADKYRKIKAMTAFVRYEQNDEVTGTFSANCNARLIWGGDLSIRNIRKLPIPERCVDIAFADRYSICIIDAPSVIKLDEIELVRLSEDFYNDTYLMDQNACSSPHLIIWHGAEKEVAKEIFWNAVYNKVSKKYQLEVVSAVEKYTLLCKNAIDLNNIKNFKKHRNYLYRIEINDLINDIDRYRGKFGHFFEYDTDEINEIARIVNNKFQTLTYFGINKLVLKDLVLENSLLGIDRIVPIGQAMDIGVIWDGYDVVRSLSRVLEMK
jgi:hypothetical protein